MNEQVFWITLIPIVYLVCSIPFSFLIGRVLYGINLREHGSGNLGATNTWRVLGRRAGISVLVLDATKGVIALEAVQYMSALLRDRDLSSGETMALILVASLAHGFSLYVKLRGGKGVAVATGILLWEATGAALVLIAIFVVVVAISRHVSLGSIVAALLLPASMAVFYSEEPAVIVICVITGAFIVWKHRSNIHRLVNGTENKIRLRDK